MYMKRSQSYPKLFNSVPKTSLESSEQTKSLIGQRPESPLLTRRAANQNDRLYRDDDSSRIQRSPLRRSPTPKIDPSWPRPEPNIRSMFRASLIRPEKPSAMASFPASARTSGLSASPDLGY